MKTLEEKSKDYTSNKMCLSLGISPDCLNRTDAFIQKFCGMDIEEAYEDGALEALGS